MSRKKLTKKNIEKKETEKKAKLLRAIKFKNEFKKTTHTAIVAAFSFLIALSWRDLISEYIIQLTALSPIGGKWVSAIIVTFLGVLGILIVSKYLSTESIN